MVAPSALRPLTDMLDERELRAANRVLHAYGLKPLEPPHVRLLDALNRLSYLDTTSYIDGATAVRRAIDHSQEGNHGN